MKRNDWAIGGECLSEPRLFFLLRVIEVYEKKSEYFCWKLPNILQPHVSQVSMNLKFTIFQFI